MAAFIQKLFKSRKSSVTREQSGKQVPPAEPRQEDPRASQRQEQSQTLAGAPDQTTLAGLAIDGVTADIRQQAASQLTSDEHLLRVQKQAKGRDKGVYQTVKQTLQAIREEQARQTSLNQTIATLINNASEQARSDDTKLYQARLEALQNRWAEVETHASPEQTQAFLEATHRCKDRLEAIQSAQESEQRQRDQSVQRHETLSLLDTTLDDLKRQQPDTLPSLSSLDALQKTQENRWLEATRDTDVDKQEQKAYERQMLALRTYLAAIRRINQEQENIAAVTAAAESEQEPGDQHRDQAQALLRALEWPDGFPLPAPLEPLRKLAGKRKPAPAKAVDQEQQKTLTRDLEVSIDRLESALEAKQLKESKQLLKTAQQQFRSLDGRHGKPYQARMQLLAGQLHELSDWHGFATKPKQIDLCERMEYLIEQPIEPEAKAERIKELQGEWRNLGGSSDRDLWARFKQASDQAYEPCKQYFSAKSGLKQANLEKRQTICDELESFIDNADWASVDWKGAEKIHLTARQEWKAAWPVEFRDNRPVQKRFDGLLKRLEAPLDEERRKNEALKQGIVDAANELVTHEPLQEAMNKAKALQHDWKAIGITRHREDRKLWQAFRKACDQVFARRDAQRSEQKQAAAAADETALSALQAATAGLNDNSEQTAADSLRQLQELDNSALSPGVREQVQATRKQLQQAITQQHLKDNISRWQTLVESRVSQALPATQVPAHWPELVADAETLEDQELVIRAEILSGVASPTADQQRRMEIQVQRLAAGIGSSDKAANTTEELEKLVAAWCLKDSEPAPNQALAERLNCALAAQLQDQGS